MRLITNDVLKWKNGNVSDAQLWAYGDTEREEMSHFRGVAGICEEGAPAFRCPMTLFAVTSCVALHHSVLQCQLGLYWFLNSDIETCVEFASSAAEQGHFPAAPSLGWSSWGSFPEILHQHSLPRHSCDFQRCGINLEFFFQISSLSPKGENF